MSTQSEAVVTGIGRLIGTVRLAALFAVLQVLPAHSQPGLPALRPLLEVSDLIVLGDVKHGVSDRVRFFSSEPFFAAMAAAGVRHVAIEMPRVLGRQAMTVKTEADVDAFASDIVRAGRWHFTDPDHPGEPREDIQFRVAAGLGRQVFLAKKYGINPIFYDFNNPLGNFETHNDPVYRCLANLSSVAWVRYSLDAQVMKAARLRDYSRALQS